MKTISVDKVNRVQYLKVTDKRTGELLHHYVPVLYHGQPAICDKVTKEIVLVTGQVECKM